MLRRFLLIAVAELETTAACRRQGQEIVNVMPSRLRLSPLLTFTST